MRLAIATRSERISPVFDSAGLILLVDFEAEKERSRCVAPLPADALVGRVARLKELGVAVLICGGISRTLRQMIEADGIRVYAWMAGPVDAVLEAYRHGRLREAKWLMPGCGDPEWDAARGDSCRDSGRVPPGGHTGEVKSGSDTSR